MKWMASALQGNSEVAAFEEYLESSGAMDDKAPEDDTLESRRRDDRYAEDQDKETSDEIDDEAEETEADEEAEADESEEEDADETDDADDKSEDSDEDDITTLGGLADYFELEESEVLEHLEVDGLDGQPVSIGEALNGWRESERVFEERATTQEAEHRALLSETQETSNKHLQQLASLTQGLIARITQDFSSDRMAAARMEDPERYADLIDAKTSAEKLINDSIAAMDSEANRRQTQSQDDIRKILTRENELLLKARPEWRDPKVHGKALKDGIKYLLESGWKQQEIDAISDHKTLLLVDDAVTGRRTKKGSDGKTLKNLRKKGLKRPTAGLKARSRRDPENPKNRDRQKAYARLKKTGEAKDAVDLFMDIL